LRNQNLFLPTKTLIMRKVVLLVFLLVTVSATFAQKPSLYKKQPTLSINFMLNDYSTAQYIDRTSLSQVFKNDAFSKVTDMSPGLSVGYYKGLSDHVDFMASLGGSFTSYEFKNGRSNKSDALLLEADANLNVKLLSDNYIVNPYLTAGVGASKYGPHYGAYIPLGFGIQVKLGEEVFLFTNAQYRNGITDYTNNHLNFSLGFGAPLGSAKKN
jgi:OOP family OmpA-OmpF porin